jgi:hypothetical protein
MLVITYQGQTYRFAKKDNTETEAMFRDRCWWIVKNIDNDNVKNIEHIISLSYIWISQKYYNVTYDDDTTALMKTLKDVYMKN